MRSFFEQLFRDDTFGPKMGLFNLTHICVLLFFAGFIVFFALKFKDKSKEVKTKILNILAIVCFCLYEGDFFVHPFMNQNNALDVDKLPFHLCTISIILIILTRLFPERMKVLKTPVTLLGIVGAFMYILVPTGCNGEYLFCYYTLQTLLYHGLLFSYGVLCIVFEDVDMDLSKVWVAPIVIAVEEVIALLANAAYSVPEGHANAGAHSYNWYFVSSDPFGLSESLNPFMPFIVLALFFGTYMLIFLIYHLATKKKKSV